MKAFTEQLIKATKTAITFTVVLSLAVNLLMLTVPLYMLQLFDRVIASQSSDTLIFLTLIAIVALVVMSILDTIRSRISNRVANWLDHSYNTEALQRSMRHYLWGDHYSKKSLNDLLQLRSFIASPSVFIVFDLPWVVIYLLVIFMLSVPLGIIATIGAVLLSILSILNERLIRKRLSQEQTEQSRVHQLIDSSFSNAELVQGTGMIDAMNQRLSHFSQTACQHRTQVSDRSNLISNCAKFIRLSLQVLMLGTGAYLVIAGSLTAGSMIAGSIILARALAPIEQSISGWKGMISAWRAFKRLKQFFSQTIATHNALQSKRLEGPLHVEHLSFAISKTSPRLLSDIHFHINPGEALAIIGPSSAGKSTLARLILGVWPPSLGSVRLDNIETHLMDQETSKLNFGYCPQRPAFFQSSIKDNICSYGEINESAIITAAKLLNIHERILKLPKGYDTVIEDFSLSDGFKQRIALARAFYNKPCLIVLDEPENNLDNDGLISLQQAIQTSLQHNCSIILISNRPSLAKHCHQTLILNQGKCQRIGPSSEVLGQLGGSDD